MLGVLEKLQSWARTKLNRFHSGISEICADHWLGAPAGNFIDDLQWADRGTLNLLTQLMQVDDCRLLVIVAYRDNEVDATIRRYKH